MPVEATVSSNLLRINESACFMNLTALAASIPNDCTAATMTSRAGTHIFAIKPFITTRQRYGYSIKNANREVEASRLTR